METPKIYAALAKFAVECKGIAKDSENSYFKKPDGTKARYASLSAIQEGIKAPLASAKLVLVHSVGLDTVTSTVYAEDGSSVSSTFPFILGKPQENGSAVTYAKRYNTAALLNLDTDADDDGNKANENENRSERSSAPAGTAYSCQKCNAPNVNPRLFPSKFKPGTQCYKCAKCGNYTDALQDAEDLSHLDIQSVTPKA